MDLTAVLQSIPPVAVYLLTGLLIAVESLGVPVPGETALVSASLLAAAPQSPVSPLWVAVSASLGAVAGDSVGYAVGKRYGQRLFDRLIVRFPNQLTIDHVQFAREVFARRGVWAVFFGRFIALLRILAGPLAGSLRMPYARFLAANLAGGLFWAFGTTYVLFLAGAVAHRWLAEGAWIVLGLIVASVLLGGRALHRRISREVALVAERRQAAEHGAGTAGTLGD